MPVSLLQKLAAHARRTRGVSYSLSVVAVAPTYLVLIVALFEIGFLVLTRAGVGYAAHVAARSAAVWEWADGGPYPRLAAWAALTPFVGADDERGAARQVPAEARAAAAEYATLHRGAAAPPPDAVRRKFENTAARTAVTLEAVPGPGPARVRATVTYSAPVRTAVIARFLSAARGTRDVPLTATCTMPSARPAAGTLGIPFPSPTFGGSR